MSSARTCQGRPFRTSRSTNLGQGRLSRSNLAWLAATLDVPRDRPLVATDHPATMAFVGFVSVKDWIGSAEECFPHGVSAPTAQTALDTLAYCSQARVNPRRALRELGWTGWTPPHEAVPLTQLFPARIPRPLQQAAIDLAPSVDGPAIVVIEAPLGEGKTEAAVYLADYWGAQLGRRGMYFALPTQATSYQIIAPEQEIPGKIPYMEVYGSRWVSRSSKPLLGRLCGRGWVRLPYTSATRNEAAPDMMMSGAFRVPSRPFLAR